LQILAPVVAAPPDALRFREAKTAIGDFMDVPEYVVAVEPREATRGRHTQEQNATGAQDARGLGECLLL
jgi:hypothetical protein